MHLFKKCLLPVPVQPLHGLQACYPVHPLYGPHVLFAQQAVLVTKQVVPLEYRPTPKAKG